MSQSPATPVTAPTPIAGRHWPAVVAFLVVTLGVLTADLILKNWAFNHVAGWPVALTRTNATDPATIPIHDGIVIVSHVLTLKLTTNPGAVFGLGKGSQWFFMLVSLVAVVAITRIFYMSDARAWGYHACLAAVLAGAVGNFYDRIRFNAVRDMLYLFPDVRLPFGLRWPNGSRELYPWIFNIADVALVCGVVALIVIMWRHDMKRSAERKAQG